MYELTDILVQLDRTRFHPKSDRWITLPELRSESEFPDTDVTPGQPHSSKLKTTQQKQMEERLVEKPSDAWRQSLDASSDTYIESALRKVRESNVTHPESLTRISGSWLFNQTLNSSKEK
jgi:hypothetical protein